MSRLRPEVNTHPIGRLMPTDRTRPLEQGHVDEPEGIDRLPNVLNLFSLIPVCGVVDSETNQ